MDALTKGFMQTQRCDKRLILRHYTVKSYSYRYTLFRRGGRNGWSVSPTPPSFSLGPLPTHYTGTPVTPFGSESDDKYWFRTWEVYIPGIFPFRPNTCGISCCFCFFTLLSSTHWRGGMRGTRVRRISTTPVRSIYVCRVVFDVIFARGPLCRQHLRKPFVRWSLTRHTS